MSVRIRALAIHMHSRREGTVIFNRDIPESETPTIRVTATGESIRLTPDTTHEIHSGYTRRGDTVIFRLAKSHLGKNDTAKVAGAFNDWHPAPAHKLSPGIDPETLELALPLAKVCPDGDTPVAFKFITESGIWIQPDECAPNRVRDPYGNANLLFHPHRSGRHIMRFSLRETPPADRPLTLTVGTTDGEFAITAASADAFLALEPQGRLGAVVESAGTRFRVFAPRATTLSVEIGNPADGSTRKLALSPDKNGIWEGFVAENLDGLPYSIFAEGENHDETTAFDPTERILDPYARAAAGPDGPGIILADSRFPKVGKPFTPPAVTDLVISEIHLADTLGLSGAHAGKPTYAALAEFVRRPDCPLRDRGFNAVELLPLQEFDAPHPEAKPAGYHWGYMPVNWFSPTSLYASAPRRASQVEELRDLVAAFHEAGLAVILDVVYNHTGAPNALLRLDKHHFFTFAPDATLTNCSGCGNDLRADTPAAVKLITESLRHWIEAYDIDGFRFDLAELIGAPTLEKIRAELEPVKPGLILIAEPWSFRGHIANALRGSGYASWSDGIRDTLSHYVWSARTAAELLPHLTCAHAAPSDTVHYTESHDDLCWIDRITENPANDGTVPTANDLRRTRLMFATLFVSPGALMLCGGQEFVRTKSGHHNTYIRGDLSRLTPERAEAFADMTAHVRAWIALRNSPAGSILRPTRTPPSGFHRAHIAPDGFAFALEFNATRLQEYGSRAIFAANPGTEPVAIPLPAGFETGELRLVVDGTRIATRPDDALPPDAETRIHDGHLHLPPLTAALWLS